MPLRSLVLGAVLLSAAPAFAQETPNAARASDVVRAIELGTSRVQHLLGETRQAGDSRRARCVDERLSELGATLRLALERHARASRYADRGDDQMAARERALLVRLAGRARELEQGARLCVDPDALEPNRTRVTVIIDPDVPTDAIVEPIADRRTVFTR